MSLTYEELKSFAGDVNLALGGEVMSLDEMREALKARLMPDGMEWPRFEDGELVKLGDKFLTDRGNEGTAYRIEFWKRRTNVWPLEGSDIGIVVLASGERVKRPPVLAKDGLPIKAGQTLYGEDGRVWYVDTLHPGERYEVEVPSLEIRADGTVRHKRLKARWLTHEKPEPADTWERIEDDCTRDPRSWCAKRMCGAAQMDDSECIEAWAKDLVRRAKALAERGAE